MVDSASLLFLSLNLNVLDGILKLVHFPSFDPNGYKWVLLYSFHPLIPNVVVLPANLGDRFHPAALYSIQKKINGAFLLSSE